MATGEADNVSVGVETNRFGIIVFRETKGWNLNVYNRSATVDGKEYTAPHRYDYDDEQNGVMKVHSDPMEADTDGDGYWDGWVGVYGVGQPDDDVLCTEGSASIPIGKVD